MRDRQRSQIFARTLVGIAALSSGGAFAQQQWTCGCRAHPTLAPANDAPSDCAYASNTPSSAYDPTFVYEIQVVFHVVMDTNGAGALTNQEIQSQVARLNEDYSGATLGQGRDTGLRFRLATVDPAGQPTSGITRTTNGAWFRDQGNYAATLAWDTSRYLNVYTLMPLFGAAGYVPDLPQGGIAGTPEDRVVMSYQVIGQPQTEMILAHEVGHWLGLYHTFGAQAPSCQNTSCSTQGDLICDTNPHTSPSQVCTGGTGSCGVPAPEHNYMNYLDVSCMYEFTPEQIQRMRCTLEQWRPGMGAMGTLGTRYCQATANSTGAGARITAGGSERVSDNALAFTVEALPVGSYGILLNARARGLVANPGGSQGDLCLGNPVGRHMLNILQAGASGSVMLGVDLSAMPRPTGLVSANAGETWTFQYWFRDALGGSAVSNFSDAVELLLR